MFDSLRKKLFSFVNAVVEKAAGKGAEEEQKQPAGLEKPVVEPKVHEVPLQLPEEKQLEKAEAFGDAEAEKIPAPMPRAEKPAPAAEKIEREKLHEKTVEKVVVEEVPKIERKPEEKQLDFAPRLGLLSRVKSVFSPEIQLKESEIEPAVQNLEVALLESDVSFDASQEFLKQLKGRLAGKKVKSASAGEQIREEIRNSLLALFPAKQFDLFNHVIALKQKGEVAVVLFVGPNGSGKTTTIAKLAKQFEERGLSSVIAAGDTFRKAAIEQAKLHGEKLGVKVVAHQYGSDPTAVAFDAVQHAKTSGKSVVLVDTAGRQETNFNLVREMEKMNRVLKPELRIFVGEAIAGNALSEQVKQFHKAIKLDGIILTKLDCDAKGGGAFSIAFETGLPILMVGFGQEYSDLKKFDAEWLCDRVLAG